MRKRVATILVAKWEKEFDAERARRMLNGESAAAETEIAEPSAEPCRS